MLTQADIKHFQEKGWVGPVDIFSAAEISVVKECLETNSRTIKEADGQKIITFYNNVYNLETPRDHHLFHQPIYTLFKRPTLIYKLNQIAGENLLLWYTNVFCKTPGQGEIKWHQAKEFYTSSDIDFEKKTLVYSTDEDPLNLTVWVALEDADLENGCIRFANGSHQQIFKILKGSVSASEGVFAGISAHKTVWQKEQQYSLSYEFDENDWEVESVPVKAGQAVIFTESVMHGSLPNQSNRRRLAIIGRYVRPSTQVYPYRTKGDFIDENGHNIKRHFCILVSGRDNYEHNVVRDWHDLDKTEVEFQLMSNLVRFGRVNVPEGKLQLEIYGLEKQATEGDCAELEPNPILHPRKYIQWQAWNQYQGMSQAEAMKRYSQLVATLPRKDTKDSTSGIINSGGANKGQFQAGDIQSWLISYLAELLEMQPLEIEINVPFERYGLSSAEGTVLIGDLEAWVGYQLAPTLVYEYPTIEALSQHIAREMQVLA
ncbi:acyl-CoA-binding protein [Rivularia sp. UHCC 0363]|uniref:acyl-CoA-binding protein n=1 Tax=Rivularia sp. UHCC 0363 TaxID=3110244 RepID=UPI002B203FC2|nr:acyl-CoA-binding protein [Rivularia sp. UHCC 0363]MEA5595932.1 acyl-CoA-binding protein [Rivularia sp. UHCC 0363]